MRLGRTGNPPGKLRHPVAGESTHRQTHTGSRRRVDRPGRRTGLTSGPAHTLRSAPFRGSEVGEPGAAGTVGRPASPDARTPSRLGGGRRRRGWRGQATRQTGSASRSPESRHTDRRTPVPASVSTTQGDERARPHGRPASQPARALRDAHLPAAPRPRGGGDPPDGINHLSPGSRHTDRRTPVPAGVSTTQPDRRALPTGRTESPHAPKHAPSQGSDAGEHGGAGRSGALDTAQARRVPTWPGWPGRLFRPVVRPCL
jgi:hypothetical protein